MQACRDRCVAHSSSCLSAAWLSLRSASSAASGCIHVLTFPTICKIGSCVTCKLCELLAPGHRHVYPRLARKLQWQQDTSCSG